MKKYDDTYSIDEDGTVYNTKRGTTLKPRMRNSYKFITLHYTTHPNHYSGSLHRLVARVWLGDPPTEKHCEVDHIDRNPLNNHKDNLRWVTRSENQYNRRADTRARKHSSSGVLYIRVCERDKGLGYQVHINNSKVKHSSIHDTLEEAIAVRDSKLTPEQAGLI